MKDGASGFSNPNRMRHLSPGTPAIVLIEDDQNVALILRLHLERAGWAVKPAATVEAARRIVFGEEWDLVVLDRRLPDGDGVDLCREIRQQFPHGYILMLTGEASAEAKLEGFNCGADDYVTKPFQTDELLARMKAALRIVELQKKLVESNRQLEELSLTDGLTALRNRRAFDEHLGATFRQARRYERPLSLAIVDVDHFKSVNDTRGHQAGDAVLRGMAEILGRVSRGADFVARIGGEEFAIVLPETGLFEALQFAEKIRAAVATSDLDVTASVGVASIPHTQIETTDELLRAADEALYRAKQRGRNRVEAEKRRERTRKETAPMIHLRACATL